MDDARRKILTTYTVVSTKKSIPCSIRRLSSTVSHSTQAGRQNRWEKAGNKEVRPSSDLVVATFRKLRRSQF